MGCEGAALATLVSYIVVFIVMLFIWRFGKISLTLCELQKTQQSVKEIVTKGLPSGSVQAGYLATTIFCNYFMNQAFGGRYGGDEFILLLHDVTADDMQLIADRLLSYVRSTLSYIPVTLSIGGALYEGDITGYDSEVLTKEADTALYKSKENGRDRYTGVSNEKTG